jgi:hypothetical protein
LQANAKATAAYHKENSVLMLAQAPKPKSQAIANADANAAAAALPSRAVEKKTKRGKFTLYSPLT